jgi:dihydroceramidase
MEPTNISPRCELNYVVSFYVAEFFNATSNIAIIVAAMLLFPTVLRMQLGNYFLLLLVLSIFVGLGSFAFHATLQLTSQVR